MLSQSNAHDEGRRRLLHRLNGQLLKHLNRMLELQPEWDLRDWIINVILLHREVAEYYTARLETSATYHFGTLFDGSQRFDSNKVASFDLLVESNSSFSGYSTITSEVVWIDDLTALETTKACPPQFREVADAYRSFGLVAVNAPRRKPKAEYVFPILTPIGLQHIVLGVLNMEYFPQDSSRPSPFAGKQLLIANLVARLLNHHASFILLAGLPALNSLTDREQEDDIGACASAEEELATDAGRLTSTTMSDVLRLHQSILDEHVSITFPPRPA